MAQDFTLGRAGLATSAGGDGLELHADSWSQDGDRAAVSGVIRGRDLSSLADVKALRDQLTGYGPENTDEPVVPVTWAQDSSRDGFYRVLGVDVGSELSGRLRAGADGAELAVPWSAELVRVPGWQAPLIEVQGLGSTRTNSHSFTATYWCGIPYEAGAVYPQGGSSITSAGSQGLVGGGYVTVGTGSGLASDSMVYNIAAADFYEGSCRIEYSPDGGTTWRMVTGRQIPNGVNWRISNGQARWTQSAYKTYTFGGNPSTTGAYENKAVYVASTNSGGDFQSVTVLRNSPEVVAVRVWDGSAGGSLTSGMYVDFVLSRGAGWVEGVVVHRPATTDTAFIELVTPEAGTSITGGLEATSADANGNKYRLYSTVATTKDTTNGMITATSAAQRFPFMVTYNTMTSGSYTPLQFWIAAMDFRQSVVSR